MVGILTGISKQYMRYLLKNLCDVSLNFEDLDWLLKNILSRMERKQHFGI